MKNYGKRKIPRTIWEFEDLIGPFYFEMDYSKTIDLLLSFWKRKGKSARSASFIYAGLFASSFKGNINIDGYHILQKYFIGTSDYIYDNYDEFVSYFFDLFLIKYQSVPKFLKKFYKNLDWILPFDLTEDYFDIYYLKKIASREVSYNNSWIYGIDHERVDIMTNALISFELKKLVEDATIEFRMKKGLSPISSQWSSEQYLLDKIKTTFPKEVVIGQGSPIWLEGQRFDIWLPELNAAIEYNGIQHYKPVDIFGGFEGFLATQSRDKLKRNKCKTNGVQLLEVKEGYKFKDVELWINSII